MTPLLPQLPTRDPIPKMRNLNSEHSSECLGLLCSANREQIDRLARFIESIDNSLFMISDALGPSIASHVRHIIEHYEHLLDNHAEGSLDYRRRPRDQDLESNQSLAGNRLRALLDKLHAKHLTAPPTRVLLLQPDIPPRPNTTDRQVVTTLGRELGFLVGHTVHHMAVIAVLVRARGGEVEQAFGMADSTLRYQANRQFHVG